MSKLEIEIGDTVKIAESSKYYDRGESNPTCEGVYNKDDGAGNLSHRVDWVNGVSDWYNLHDLILIKKGKTMQFTKSDLKTGVHFTKDREGIFSAVFKNTFCGDNGFVPLSSFNDELFNVNGHSELDIVEVYETHGDRSMTSYLKGLGLRRIWERTEQTEAQKEMEVLQEQAKALQEQITKLQSKL
jgi:hypothetical protein